MPEITPFIDQQAYPTAPPLGGGMDPEAAGLVASSIARGTAGLTSDLQDMAARFAQQKRMVAASDAMVGLDGQLSDAALRWGRVADRDQAVTGFNDEADQLRKQAVNGISDPLIQGAVAQRFDEARIQHSHNVEQSSFGLEASQARGNLDMQLAQLSQQAATAPSPETRQQALDDADRAILVRSPIYMTPEDAAKERIQFRSNVQKIQAMQYIRDATQGDNITRLSPLDVANHIADSANFPGLLPADRQSLADQAVRLGRTIVSMREADQAHADAMADKNLKRDQAANSASLIDQIRNTPPGKPLPVDETNLSELVRTQKISDAGYTAGVTALNRRQAGTDDPATVIDLQRRAANGENVTDDALKAYGAGQLKSETLIGLGKSVDARANGGETPIDKSNFANLKGVLQGAAIEQGLVDLTKQAGRDRAELWSNAQTEWDQRVLQGHEDSTAVLADMKQRYIKIDATPASLPAPRLGAIGSAADVSAIAQKTQAAADAGQITPAQLGDEKALILRYQQFYAEQAKNAAALAGTKGSQGGGAQPMGATPAGAP